MLLLFISDSPYLYADNDKKIHFEPDFIELNNKGTVDLSQFEDNEQLAGTYRVDIFVNNKLATTQEISFFKALNGTLSPCLSIHLISEFGIKIDDYRMLSYSNLECIDISVIPNAKTVFDFDSQSLYLSIPQIALVGTPRGYINLADVDNGINALLLNYSYNGSKNHDNQNTYSNQTSHYINLRPGINVDAWRLRNYTTWSNHTNQHSQWDTIYTYASRNINPLKSQLILGDSISPSTVFDSVPFRGLQIATDEEMYPDSLRGYAPVIRGIAPSNAEITIRQNGYIIYQTNVAAGPFEISDLYPTGSSGDLYVAIKESNGQEQVQIIPFASLPILRRDGYLSYSVTGGEYRSYDHRVDKTQFGQITLIYGLPYGITGYGGSQISRYYQSYSMGYGQNLGHVGAVSVDITQADSTLNNGDKHRGQSYRIRYNKNLNDIGTNITLAGYRYSTEGFYLLPEVFNDYQGDRTISAPERRRNRGEISLNQYLGSNYGSISMSLVSEDYWNSNRNTQSTSFSYNNSWQGMNYGLNYSYNKNTHSSMYDGAKKNTRDDNHQLAFSLSIPFNLFEDTAYINIYSNSNNDRERSGTIGISASQMNNQLNGGIQQGFANNGQNGTGNINMSYKGQYGELSGGTGYSKNNYNIYYGVNGSMVAHSNGIVLGQQLGETTALVEIPDAPGVPIRNHAGVITNHQGYALVPYISSYTKNKIDIDVSKLPENTEMNLTSQSVVPSRGALTKTRFEANVGYRALMVITFSDGTPVPFGASVFSHENRHANSIIGNDGEAYLSGLVEKGHFIVQYKNKEYCQVNYDLTGLKSYLGLYKTTAICH